MVEKAISAFRKYKEKDKIPGLSLSIIAGGKTVQHCLGSLETTSNTPVDNLTAFEIGSLTKPIVALVFSILNGKNEINLDKPVSHYFKAGSVHSIFDIIIIKDILSHTSGLPRLPAFFLQKMTDLNDPYASLNRSDLYEYLQNPSEINKPGKYCYSNLGYGLLGEILKTKFNTSLYELTRELIFNPLNMHRTKPLEQFGNDTNIARGHTIKNTGTAYWRDDVLEGAGFLLSCNEDMNKFLALQLSPADHPLGDAILRTHELLSRKTGMGWHIKNGLFARLLGYSGYIWHNGMTGGFSSFMAFNKKKEVGFTLLANKAIILDSYFYRFASYF